MKEAVIISTLLGLWFIDTKFASTLANSQPEIFQNCLYLIKGSLQVLCQFEVIILLMFRCADKETTQHTRLWWGKLVLLMILCFTLS